MPTGKRVPCGWYDTISGLDRQHTSATRSRGIFLGLWKKKGEPVRTAKSRRLSGKPSAFSSARENC